MNGYNAGCEGWFIGYMFGLKEDRSEGWIGKMHSVGDGRAMADPRNILCKRLPVGNSTLIRRIADPVHKPQS